MAEPEGREGLEASAEASPMPEGAGVEAGSGSAESSAHGEGVQAFRGSATSTGNLDLQVELDEPEQLVRELYAIAGRMRDKGDKRGAWSVVVIHAHNAIRQLEELNQAGQRLAEPENPD